jgi:ferric-dicitrate binding protein FerR (iron transport regulator)
MDKQSNDKTDINIDTLLSQISARTEPDTDKALKSKAQVAAHWQKAVKNRRQKVQKTYWAMAAALALVFTISLLNINKSVVDSEPVMFATIQSVHGQVLIQRNQQWVPIDEINTVTAGTRIKTSENSFLSLKMNDNSELRIAANTTLLSGENYIELQQGQIYHDTDISIQAAPLTIKTSQGQIQHIGTKYLVASNADQLKVAVRSGQVQMTPTQTGLNQQIIQSKQLVSISPNGTLKTEQINNYGSIWDWTFKAQGGFNLNNKSLYDFIEWYSYQTGLTVDWQNLESMSKRVRLQGNISNMSSQQAIKSVFNSTQYTYSIDNGILQISQQKQ